MESGLRVVELVSAARRRSSNLLVDLGPPWHGPAKSRACRWRRLTTGGSAWRLRWMGSVETKSRERSRIGVAALPIAFLLIPLLLWRVVGYRYSEGDRVGFVEGVSEEGTVCHTYEGTLLMGATPSARPNRRSVGRYGQSGSAIIDLPPGSSV